MKFVNATPHTIRLYLGDNNWLDFHPANRIVRLEEKVIEEEQGTVRHEDEHIPVVLVRKSIGRPVVIDVASGKNIGLFEIAPDDLAFYIVSTPVLHWVKMSNVSWGARIVSPDTGGTSIRSSKGHLIGITRFVRA